MYTILVLAFFVLTVIRDVRSTVVEQSIRSCMTSNDDRQPLLIDTDTDIDDLWAIHYILNVPTINVLAITTVGNAYSGPFYSASNVLRFLDMIGCKDRIPVAYGLNLPLLSSGWQLSSALLTSINTYFTNPTCLNQSVTNIFIQPSPFDAVELIKLTLTYSPKPVDILVLGTMTNIAAAIAEDRSIVAKIRTLYFSGGQFKSTADYASLLPDLATMAFPYSFKTPQSSSNVFLDVLAAQRVGESLIDNLVAMPSLTQRQLPTNITQLNTKLNQLQITLPPFVYQYLTSFARCTNQSDTEIYWWDNSAAAFMVQLQSNTSGFCKEIKAVQSIYILAADVHALYGQGMTDLDKLNATVEGLPTYKICTRANPDEFLTEFLTKIHSNQLYSCRHSFAQRFDIKLQQCLRMHALDSERSEAHSWERMMLSTVLMLLFLHLLFSDG